MTNKSHDVTNEVWTIRSTLDKSADKSKFHLK